MITGEVRPEDLRDHAAERALLAIALHGNPESFLTVPVVAYDHWKAQALATAMRTVLENGSPLDMSVVARAILAQEGAKTRGQEINVALAEIGTMDFFGDAGPYYAERIMKLYGMRRLWEQVNTFWRHISYANVNDMEVVAKNAYAEIEQALEESKTAYAEEVDTLPSFQAVVDSPEQQYNWLVPNLIERTDRLILTGYEGTGKSFLTLQIACAVAAGLHPFAGMALPRPPYRVVILDCENSFAQIRRRLGGVMAQIDEMRYSMGMTKVDWSENSRLISHPEGMNLADLGEFARLDHQLDKIKPDLVVCGPLYKMSKLDYRDEQAAKELCDALDSLRVRHGFALVAEAHTGHGEGGVRSSRPIGSSLFLRWPEFGLGLVPADEVTGEEHPSVVNVKRWRGSREKREWPKRLRYGHYLPWVSDDDYRAPEAPSTTW